MTLQGLVAGDPAEPAAKVLVLAQRLQSLVCHEKSLLHHVLCGVVVAAERGTARTTRSIGSVLCDEDLEGFVHIDLDRFHRVKHQVPLGPQRFQGSTRQFSNSGLAVPAPALTTLAVTLTCRPRK